jgi:hypothetical protein
MPLDSVTYYHVEIERHDVLLAHGLPAESYLDTGNRSHFSNGDRTVSLHPSLAPLIWDGVGCARMVVTGPELVAVKIHLDLRSRETLAAA